jgi:hypothetical protein
MYPEVGYSEAKVSEGVRGRRPFSVRRLMWYYHLPYDDLPGPGLV